MFILFDYLRLDQSNMRLSASPKPAKQPPSINEIIGTCNPEGKRRRMLIVPGGPALITMLFVHLFLFILFVFNVLDFPFLPRLENAFLLCKAFPPKPPSHAFRADIDVRTLKHSITQILLPSIISPIEQEREDQVAHCTIQSAW